ncbi:hypothetical protein C9374_009278 [Naegleria lovaniensis]|uniref:Uncharacterized protein n=1 Tax=Naegleria lovaniensis TaxID=51637 RepID=A0AA88KEB4_NAELO|nr:uncharacterized protein C9374_009278 [Naegleria lovaniensis]KAG2377367.1 hypothetical protein C9374_009278 [Naegleria lovaniensis]
MTSQFPSSNLKKIQAFMCIVSISTCAESSNSVEGETSTNTRYPFILISNRDEEYDRPTHSDFQLVAGSILCVTDLVYHNTWLGVNIHNGSMAIVTNVDDDYAEQIPTLELYKKKEPSSSKLPLNHSHDQAYCHAKESQSKTTKVIRSRLLLDLLLEKQDMKSHNDYIELVKKHEHEWLQTKGCIVLCGNLFSYLDSSTPSDLVYFTNREFIRDEHGKPLSQWPVKLTKHLHIERLTNGETYCASNSFLNDHLWQKVKVLRERMHECFREVNNDQSPQDLVSKFSKLLNIRNINEYQDNSISINDIDKFSDEFMKEHQFEVEPIALIKEYKQKFQNTSPNSNSHTTTNSQANLKNPQFLAERRIDIHLYDRSTINDIFVHYQSKFTNWKTKSQSIIIVDRFEKKIHFFFRDVNEYSLINDELNSTLPWNSKEIVLSSF